MRLGETTRKTLHARGWTDEQIAEYLPPPAERPSVYSGTIEYWPASLMRVVEDCETLYRFGIVEAQRAEVARMKKQALCCWCDEPATGQPVRYAGVNYPACQNHNAEHNTPVSYSNEDFDRINRAIRPPVWC